MLFPQALPMPCQPVLISRSGHTSEAVEATEYLERVKKLQTLAKAMTAESRVASIPGWVWIATSAAYCTGVRSKDLHSSTKIATAICCMRRNR